MDDTSLLFPEINPQGIIISSPVLDQEETEMVSYLSTNCSTIIKSADPGIDGYCDHERLGSQMRK